MPESITRVAYQAIADFSQLHIAANEAIADLDRIKAKEAEVNAASSLGAAQARNEDTKAQTSQAAAIQNTIKAIADSTAAQKAETAATQASTSATKESTVAEQAKVAFTKMSTDADKAAADSKKALLAEMKIYNAAKKEEAALEAFATSKKQDAIKAEKEATAATKAGSSALKSVATDIGGVAKALGSNILALFGHKKALDENTSSANGFRASFNRLIDDVAKGSSTLAGAAGKGLAGLMAPGQTGGGGGAAAGAGGAAAGAGAGLAAAGIGVLIAGLITIIGPLLAGFGAITAAAMGLIDTLASLSAALLAAPAAMGSYITVMETVKLAFQGVGAAVTAQQAAMNGTGTNAAYLKALQALSPAAQTFVKWLGTMSDAWSNLQSMVQDNFFSAFVGDLQKAAPILDAVANVMGKASSAVGGVVDKLILSMSQGGALSLLNRFADQNASLITTLGGALLSLLDVFIKIADVAAPFTQKFADAIAGAANQLDILLSKADVNGSLIKWLQTAWGNMKTWWGIISDIGKNLFNYGIAAEQFSEWMTNGLKKVADGWVTMSEAALKPGSDFQKWLENVKPLLTEMGKVFGGILDYIKKAATDPTNISKMFDMLKTIHDVWGPALGTLLDKLSKTNVGPDLIKVIGALLQLVNALVSAQTLSAISALLDVLTNIITAIAPIISWAVSLPPVATAITVIATALGTIAALRALDSATNFVTQLITLASKEGALGKIFAALTGVESFAAPGTAAKAAAAAEGGAAAGSAGAAVEGGAAGAALGAYGKTGGLAGLARGAVGGGAILAAGYLGAKGISDNAPDVFNSINDFNKIGWGAGLSDNPKLRARANRDAGNAVADTLLPAGLTGLMDTINPGMGKDFHKNVSNFATGAEGHYGDAIRGFGQGLSKDVQNIGNTKIGNTTIGAGLAHGAQQIGDFATKDVPAAWKAGDKAISGIFDPKSWSNGAKEIGDFFTKTLPTAAKNGLKQIGDFFKPVTDAFSHGAKQIGDFFTKTLPEAGQHGLKQIGDFFTKTLPDGFKHGAQQIGDFFTKTLPFAAGYAVGAVIKFFKGLPDAFMHGAKQIGDWFSSLGKNGDKAMADVGKAFQHGWDQIVTFFSKAGPAIWNALQDAGKWISDQAAKFSHWLNVDVPVFFVKAGAAIWSALQDAGKWIVEQSAKFVTWLASLPATFMRFGAAIWSALQDAGKWLTDQGTKFYNWITGLPGQIGKWVGDLWGQLPSIGGWISDQAGKVASFVSGIASSIGNAFNKGMAAGQGKHSGGTIYRSGGGSVPGSGDYDSVNAMLTPGEVVIRKSIVDAVGEQNLLALNDGLISYQQLLTKAMSQDPISKNKSYPSFLTGSGLTGTASLSSLPSNSSAVNFANSSSGSSSSGSGFHIENLNVINPTPERASDSLPRTIRKVGYLSTARGR